MIDTISEPEWASERDREVIERLNRKGRIRHRFSTLRKQGKKKMLAYEIIAQEEECSPSHVCKIVNGER